MKAKDREFVGERLVVHGEVKDQIGAGNEDELKS